METLIEEQLSRQRAHGTRRLAIAAAIVAALGLGAAVGNWIEHRGTLFGGIVGTTSKPAALTLQMDAKVPDFGPTSAARKPAPAPQKKTPYARDSRKSGR